MESEALRKIRTMRQIKTSVDVARSQKLRTTNSLPKTKEEIEYLESLSDSRLVEQVLQKERKRFAALDASVEKSKERLIKSRGKLAATINKNRALTELRHELQRARWEGKDPTLPKTEQTIFEQDLRQMEVEY
jgi:hypothetical protein